MDTFAIQFKNSLMSYNLKRAVGRVCGNIWFLYPLPSTRTLKHEYMSCNYHDYTFHHRSDMYPLHSTKVSIHLKITKMQRQPCNKILFDIKYRPMIESY